MNKTIRLFLLGSILLIACTPAATPTLPPKATNTPRPTTEPTIIPSPTPLPGSLTLPLDSFNQGIPWLTYNEKEIPSVYYFGINLEMAPFNSVLVRKAFAASIDREAIIEIVDKYDDANRRPATTLVPPEILGRDLYNQVGIPYDPAQARKYLEEAGYTDTSSFPAVTIWVNVSGDAAPAAHAKVAEAAIDMWQTVLGVEVNYELMNWDQYQEKLSANPPGIYRLGWLADYNDPDNFFGPLTYSDGNSNYGGISISKLDRIIDEAAGTEDPVIRQQLYIEAERILCEAEAALIPLYHYTIYR
ncbi:MAG: hypothetical protein JXA13_09920 [Anaerolineales bacterium]|nr:hypothetical protein [Anaerolineales bacterium]